MALTAQQVQQFYIGYYGRPADPVGLAYWQTQDEAAALKGFSESAEFTNQFTGLSASQQVTKVYGNLLGRAPDAPGLLYWAGELTAGRETIGSLVLSMLKNALGKDVTTIEDRVTYSTSFTTALNTAEEINAYAGTAATQAARDALLKVVATAVGDHTALNTELTKIDATISTIVAGGGSAPSQTFTLTKAGAVLTSVTSADVTPTGKLSTANDTVEALTFLNTSIIRDASTNDADVLNALISAATTPGVVENIERINAEFTNAAGDLVIGTISGTKTFGVKTTTDGKISGIDSTKTTQPTFLLNGGTGTVNLEVATNAGTADSLSLKVEGYQGGLNLTTVAGADGVEKVNLEAAGAASKVVLGNFAGVAEDLVITGSSDLTLVADADNILTGGGTATVKKISGSGHTGTLTLQLGKTSATTAITDTALDLAAYAGVDKAVLNDNTVVTVSNASSGLIVDLNSDLAFATLTVTGTAAVADPASNADVLNVNLTGSKTANTSGNVTGALTFTNFETLNITSTGAAHTIGDLTTTGSATALDTVTVKGNKDLTLTGTANFSGVEKLDATGFTGKLIMGAAGANLLSLIGGDGNDTLYTGGNATSATIADAGKGDDTINLGVNKDSVKGGEGKDTFVLSLANTFRAQGDVIGDFTSGTDVFKVGATIKAATTAATLTTQELAWNTDLATTLGTGAFTTTNAAYLVKIADGAGVGTNLGKVYLILNNGTGGYVDGDDGVVELVGVTALTINDFAA